MRLVLVPLLVLAVPSAAQAATIRVSTTCSGRGECWTSVTFTAAPGERNDVLVQRTPSGGYEITDTGAEITGDCEPRGLHAAACPAGSVGLELGDGDDRASGASWTTGGEGDDVLEGYSSVSGGAGNDRLTATGLGYTQLYGEEGDDVLLGSDEREHMQPGPGRDVVLAGGGDDAVYDDDPAPGADELDGGTGLDVLSLYPRLTGGAIDLSVQSNSDGDVVRHFDNAAGGIGDDLLVGNDGDNRLYGEAGEDVLLGAGGNDWLEGNLGFDTFDGGPGWDRIAATGGAPNYDSIGHGSGPRPDSRDEPIACGDGPDEIISLFQDVVGADCERIGRWQSPRPARVRGTRVTFRIPCRGRHRCRGTLRVDDAGGYSFGRRPRVTRFDLEPPKGGRVTVRLLSPYCACKAYDVTITTGAGENRSVQAWTLPEVR